MTLMKRILSLLLVLAQLALLCACAAEPVQELPTLPETPPAAPAPQTGASASAPTGEEAEETQPAPIPDGIYAQDGKAYYYQDGAPLTDAGLAAVDGGHVYVQADGSLFPFAAGVNRCGEQLYYHTGESAYLLASPEAGLYEDADALYLVQDDLSLLAGGSEGYLTFGADGRYTGGSEALDEGVASLLAACGAEWQLPAGERLRLCYDYIRDNYTYISMEHYAAGTTDWAQEAAEAFLRQGKGNCYCFAALFMYCARRLGYQAYVVAGHESRADNDHAWTMIDEADGTYLYDVQLEYAYLYIYNKGAIDVFRAAESDGLYNGFAYFFPET